MNQCKNCPNEAKKSFCSRSCAASFNNRAKLKRRCETCGILIPSRKSRFCTKKCEGIRRAEERRDKFNAGEYSPLSTKSVSEHLRELRGDQCEKCEWKTVHPVTEKVPLQVHHIDGDYTNNHPSNLELLCPNCHSLTDTFGNLNEGNGRKYRYEN